MGNDVFTGAGQRARAALPPSRSAPSVGEGGRASAPCGEGIVLRSGRPVAVLVDAYASGHHFLPAFERAGADCVHVQSTPNPLASAPSTDFSVYDVNVVHVDIDKTLAVLRDYPVVCVVAGHEPGVLLADELSDAMGLPTNGPVTSRLRRDKYEMIEALRAAGLHCAQQFKSGDAEEIVDWAERAGPYPFVVKPLSSAGTDGVQICHDTEQVRRAATSVLGSTDVHAQPNDEVLIQTYLDGPEYVVDMVSYAGMRYTVHAWKYHKRLVHGTRRIYDIDRLVPADASPVPELVSYVDAAMDALGVRFGPSHAEVIVTPDGPALVEVGARLSGGVHPGFHDRCLGANQADLTALAYLDPGSFITRYAGRTYAQREEAIAYATPTELDGVVERIDDAVVAEIRALPTVFDVDVKVRPGSRIRPTVDLFSATMRVFMCAADYADIQRDYERLQGLKDRVFVLR
jgi:carbamoylphosphate synthase large subunit